MMRPEQRLLWAQVLVWFIPALWAVNYFCARLAPGVVDPHTLALGRWAIAGLILGGLARHEIWQARHQIWSDRWQYLALGTLGMLICGAWVYWGAQTTSAMNIALIYAAAPVLIAWGSAIWLDERMRPRQMFGVALALAGVVHVVVKGNWVALTQMQWSMGDVLIMAATLSWAAYALLQKKWVCTLSSTARLACICALGKLATTGTAVDLVRHHFVAGGGLGARHWGLLDLRLGAKNPGCQPHQHDLVSRAFVGRLGVLGFAGRVFGLAPRRGQLVDFAGRGAGGSTFGGDQDRLRGFVRWHHHIWGGRFQSVGKMRLHPLQAQAGVARCQGIHQGLVLEQ